MDTKPSQPVIQVLQRPPDLSQGKSPLTEVRAEAVRVIEKSTTDALNVACASSPSQLQSLTPQPQQQITAAAAEAARKSIEKETNRNHRIVWQSKIFEKSHAPDDGA